MLGLSTLLFFGGLLGFIVAFFSWTDDGVSPKAGYVSIWLSLCSMGLGAVAYLLWLLGQG